MRSWHPSPLTHHSAMLMRLVLALSLLWAGQVEARQELTVVGVLYVSGKDYYLETEDGDVFTLIGDELTLYQEDLVLVTGTALQRDGDMPLLKVSSIQPYAEGVHQPEAEAEPEEPGGPETL
ncbi:hypothetical protein V6C53_14360 [Desulfocurvibacter africanus]|nr:hypothetical protein [Desulfocurvibacter africanus]